MREVDRRHYLHQLPALQGHGLDGDLKWQRRERRVEGDVLVGREAYLVHVHDGLVRLHVFHVPRPMFRVPCSVFRVSRSRWEKGGGGGNVR